jgi:hypothetical protein
MVMTINMNTRAGLWKSSLTETLQVPVISIVECFTFDTILLIRLVRSTDAAYKA